MAYQTSVDLILAACDACVQNGTMQRRQRFTLRMVNRMFPNRFERVANTITSELSVEANLPMPSAAREGGPFEFDPDNFRAFLEILIEFLPMLLEIILPLFTSND